MQDSTYSTASTARTCPQCGSMVRRVPRHFLDRLVSLFVPHRRYRCVQAHCGWEALLNSSGVASKAVRIPPVYSTHEHRIEPSPVGKVGTPHSQQRTQRPG